MGKQAPSNTPNNPALQPTKTAANEGLVDPVCAPLQEVVDHAGNLFETVELGPYDPDLDEYNAEILLDGASECSLDKSDTTTPRYQCSWWYPNGPDAQRQAAYNDLKAYVIGCVKKTGLNGIKKSFASTPNESSDSGFRDLFIHARNGAFEGPNTDRHGPRIIFHVRENKARRGSHVVSLSVEQWSE